jgi:hypothetical protein
MDFSDRPSADDVAQFSRVFASCPGTRSVRLRPHLITGQLAVDEACGVFDAVLRELAA